MLFTPLTEKKIPAAEAASIDEAAAYMSANLAGEVEGLNRGGMVDYELPGTIGERATAGLSFMFDLIDNPVAHVAISSRHECQCPVYTYFDKEEIGTVEAAEKIGQVIGWAADCAEGKHLPEDHPLPPEPAPAQGTN